MTEETTTETTPQTELERVRAGETKTFDAPALCALLCQMLAHPAYWDSEDYLIHMQFHRDEIRTIANFMSIGIGASADHASHPEPSDEALIPSHEQPAHDSAVLGEFVQDAETT
jgi:hypothetical protein